MAKSGISTVVATVLTVLITVFSVSLLWVGAQPLLSSAAFVENPSIQFDIEKAESFTFYDPETGYLSVRVTRGSDNDDPQVVALKFVIDINGNSISRKTYNVMPPNHALVYYFLIGFDVNLNFVKVIPVYIVNGEERGGRTFELESRIPLNPGELKEEIGNLPVVQDTDNPISDGLVLFYSFDKEYENGTHIIDQSGEGHRGTLFGDIQLLNQGKREFAKFDGDGDYIFPADGQDLADVTRGDKTITFWVEFDCPIGPSNINQAPFGSHDNYFVGFVDPCNDFVNSELRINYDLPPLNPRSYTSEGIWNDLSGWEFFSIVLDQTYGEIRIYRDGQQVDIQSGLTIGSSNPSPNFYIGTKGRSDLINQDTTYYFKGSLDDLRVYNRSLSLGEIQDLHAMLA